MFFFIIIKHNSKRIKNKNFQKINGLELWKYLILTLKKQKVFIDTDSPRIIKDCKRLFPWVTVYLRLSSILQCTTFYSRLRIKYVILLSDAYAYLYLFRMM